MSSQDRITIKPTLLTHKQIEALEEITRPDWNQDVISYFFQHYNVSDLYKKNITRLLEIFIKKEKEDYIIKLTSDIDIVMNDKDDPVDYSVDKNGLFNVIPEHNKYWEPIKRYNYVDEKIFESGLGKIVEEKQQFDTDLKNAENLRTLKYIGRKELKLRNDFNESVKALCVSFDPAGTKCPENPYQYVFGKQQGGKKLRKTHKKTHKKTKRVSSK